MEIEFRKVSDFDRGILAELLSDAYSFDGRWQDCCGADWKEFDDFFFDNPLIADQYGFITVCHGQPVGLASWDPRKMPEHVEIGHNCIISSHKGNGYGAAQLREALRRIARRPVGKVIVTTNARMAPARRMYESVGFKICGRRRNESHTGIFGDYIDYEMMFRQDGRSGGPRTGRFQER